MESLKAVVEEVKCISGYPHVAQNPENSLCGGCCEGTVFTFTSAASNGKLRQRLRSRASILKAHGRQGTGTDPVFTELRIMPPRTETTSADFVPSAAIDCKPTFPHTGACGNHVTAHNSAHQTRPVEGEKSGKYCDVVEESDSRFNLEQSENVENEVKGFPYCRDEDCSESTGSMENLKKQDRETGENSSADVNVHQTGRRRVQHQEAFLNDRRMNQKRCCSGEHFCQRKLSRTGHTEQTLPAPCVDTVREEIGCKRTIEVGRTELRMDSYAESNDRLQIEAELKNLQARQHVTGIKCTMMRKRLPDQEPPVVEDPDNAVSGDKTSEVVKEKECRETENGHGSLITSGFASRRAEHVFSLKGPFTGSFTSSEGGGSKLVGKTFSFGGDSFVRAESAAQNSERKITCTETEYSAKRFAYEPVGTVEAGHLEQGVFRARSASSLGKISEVTGNTKVERNKTVDAAAKINGNLSVPVEPFSCNNALAGIEKWKESVVNLHDCETGNSSNVVQALSSKLSHSASSDLAERSEELEERIRSSTSEEQRCTWLAVSERSAVGQPLHDDSGSVKECPTQTSHQIRPAVNRGLSSVSLVNEWYGSPRSEGSDPDSYSDNDAQHFQDREDEGDFFPRDTQCFGPLCEEDDNASPVSSDGTLCRWEDNVEDENQKENCKVKSEISSLDTELKEAENRTALQGKIIHMNMSSPGESNIVNQESFCVEKEDLKSRLNTHRRSRPKRESVCATKAGLPIRRRAWRRSFKRKKNTSAEGFNNLEKWLARERSKRKASLKGYFCDPVDIRNRISLDDKHHLLLALQAVEMPGTLPTCRTRERSIASKASLSSQDEVHPTFGRSETPGSVVSDFCCESNTVSSEIVEGSLMENCNGGHLNSCPVSSEDFDHGQEVSSKVLDGEHCLDFTCTTVEDSLSDQQCVNPDVKCALPIKIGTRKSETGSVPNPTNFSTSHSAMKADSKHSTYQSGPGSNISTGRKSEIEVNRNEEEKFPEAVEDCCNSLRMRSQTSLHKEDRSRNDSPPWTPVTSSGCSLEESLNNEGGHQVCLNGNSDNLVKTRTLASFFKENMDLSVFTPQTACRVEDRKELVSRTVQPKASGKKGSRHSSDNCSSDNSEVVDRFGTDYTGLALVGAGCRRAVEASDIQKPVNSKKPKIPIVVRVRNGLATGRLLQSFIWKKFGKQKLKSSHPQSAYPEAISREDKSESRSASPRMVSDLRPSLNARPRATKDRSSNSCGASTTRKDKAYEAKDNSAEGTAAPATPAGGDIIIETVRSTPIPKKSSAREFCNHEGESDSARNCIGRRQDAREETAGLFLRDLHQQSSGNLREAEAGEGFEPEGEGNVSGELGYSSGRAALLGVHASNQSLLAVDSVAVRFVTKGSSMSDASGGDILDKAHNLERIHEQPVNTPVLHALRCELQSEKEIHPSSPANSTIPAHILDKNVLCPLSAQDPPSGEAESKNFKTETCHLAPVIWRSKDASSSSQQAECEGQVIAHCGSKIEASTTEEEDNDITKSTASSGLAVLLKTADNEKEVQPSKDVSVKVNQFSTRDIGNKAPSSPLDERSGIFNSELVEAEERREEDFRSRQEQQETHYRRLGKTVPLAHSVVSSSRNVDSVDADTIKAGTSSVCRRTPRSFKRRVPRYDREEVIQTHSTCQPTIFNRKIPGRPKSTEFESTNPETARTERDGLLTHDEPKPVPPDGFLSQGGQVDLQRQISEKGVANMRVKTAPAQLPGALQGCRAYHPPSTQWIPVETREAQGSLLSLNPNGERISTCQNHSVDSTPWNEPQESSAALTTPGCRRLDDSRVVHVQPEVWNLTSQTDFRSFDHAERKEELHGNAFINCHGQDEVFLERFSSSKDSQKSYDHQRREPSGDLAAPGVPAVPGATRRSGSFPQQDKVIPAEQASVPVKQEAEPSVIRSFSSCLASAVTAPPAPLSSQTLHSSRSNILSPQYEPDRPHSSSKTCHTCESAVPQEHRNLLASIPPLSSMNEYSENNAEKFAQKLKLRSHGSTGSGGWEHQLDGADDFKTLPTQTYSQRVPSPLPPSLVHNPTLALNSKRFCSSCRTAQPFYDTGNFACCSKSSCHQHLQVQGATPAEGQCLCGSNHILGLQSSAYALACPAETARLQHMGTQVSNDHENQHALKVGRYTPPQALPIQQPAWSVPEKNIETNVPGDCELQDCTSLHGKEQDCGLVWLTGEEMNVIRELRQSGGKDTTRSSEFLADPEPNKITSVGASDDLNGVSVHFCKKATDFYELIKTRPSSTTYHPPSFGPQMQARFLLKRGPATPLVMYPTNTPAPVLSSVAVDAVTFTSHKAENQLRPSLPRRLTVLPEGKTVHSQPVMSRRQSSSRGKGRPPAVKSGNSLMDLPESSELLPWYVLAQRSPCRQTAAGYRSSPTEFTSSLHESHTNKGSDDTVSLRSSDSANKETSPFEHVPPKTAAADSSINEIYEQPRKRNFAFDEVPIGTATANIFDANLGSSVDLSEKPKRPFLKRKSVIMPPQKLDWSKVKPMVSSRLEPQLKTKLSYCRSTKAVDRHTISSNSRRRKGKYSQVKSRLFSYEGNVSPGSSKETVPRNRYNEHDDTDTASGSRGSESGESSRLAALRRPASPDLLRLKSQVQADTEAELVYRRAQASMMDPQCEATYSSRFDSARYLHKLETSSKASRDSSVQGPQQQPQPRTQRIRLRLVPGSEENEPGRVLLQKIESREEEMPDLWHEQRVAMTRRRQSHSHRYASYRESSQADAQPDDSATLPSPPDQGTLKTSASSKMGLASKELEDMFERVIAAKCGRNITLSDIFERSSSQVSTGFL
ncbi:hypothetical protein R1sor_024141 [Riccia sorocarpa]|uniref:Uncharacterized protein n=1 Tax=Riccia sorocarpa TaxID=122646 RepID=A0ABD3GSV2_9MARC